MWKYTSVKPSAGIFNIVIFFIVRAKKQPWATSLCHSLVPHTYEERQLRFMITPVGWYHRLAK